MHDVSGRACQTAGVPGPICQKWVKRDRVPALGAWRPALGTEAMGLA